MTFRSVLLRKKEKPTSVKPVGYRSHLPSMIPLALHRRAARIALIRSLCGLPQEQVIELELLWLD
jgi:hypothetical protein